ncbi:hypothetical protein OBBRIDRAFT_822007 [Obba rivulosa]|uniref:Uncharacterized protein n=1 Tax=Obba rivulosa TaxID=1052685 RepID=A0A8E2ANW3_9APHY|nr:hypothetical protein OBBRIDRAFT_822007 [Obba rivulosa]
MNKESSSYYIPHTLDTLPVELLYEIHLYALSPSLPLASRHLYAVFKSAPSSIHAEYLLGCYLQDATRSSAARNAGLVSKVLRYPICSQLVLEAILRNPLCPSHLSGVTELPRRLFRSLAPRKRGDPHTQLLWSDEDAPLPFLRFLYSHPRIPPPDANRHDGYVLTKAVYARFLPLVSFLLTHGASPACKGALPVMVAIRQKDLALVRMLIERDGTVRAESPRKRKAADSAGTQATGAGGTQAGVERWEQGSGRGVKKRRLEDRVAVNTEMLKLAVKCDARNIVDYLREKGCVPDMQTLMMMGM